LTLIYCNSLFFFRLATLHRYSHSFPTRRSSDLLLNFVSDFPFYRTLEVAEDYLYSKMLVRYNYCASEVSEGISSIDDDSVSKVLDRKSTRLNSSHVSISYAVFCLKKKK